MSQMKGGGGSRPLFDNVQKIYAFFSDVFPKEGHGETKSAHLFILSKTEVVLRDAH
jgi:hypothetical protein